MDSKEVYLKLAKGWVVIENYTFTMCEFTKLLHNFKCEQGILRLDKKSNIYRFSIFDIDTFYNECKKQSIKVIPSKLLQLYHSNLQKKLFNKSPELDLSLWTDDTTYQLYDYQKLSVGRALATKDLIIADTLGLGKLLASYSTPILYEDGWRMIGDTKVGDKIYGVNGNLVNVTGVFPQKKHELYKIKFTDGVECKCGKEHLWKVASTHFGNRQRDGWKVKSLGEIIEISKKSKTGKYNWFFPLCQPIQFPEKQYNINPYILGVLIGDGYICGRTCTFTIGNQDQDIADKIFNIIGRHNINADFGQGCIRYNIYNNLGYLSYIQALKLNVKSLHKFIPEVYKWGSVDQRIDLLRGLMDTDGSCIKNRTIFHTTSPKLAEDIQYLVRSLGGTAKIHSYDRTREEKGIEFQVFIKINICPFYTARKKTKWKPTTRNTFTRKIESIELAEKEDAVCISVDCPEHLYVIKDFLVTHNTNQCIGTICESIVKYNFRKHIIVLPSKLRVQWYNEFLRFTKIDSDRIVIFDDPRQKGKKTKELKEKCRREIIYSAEILLISYNMVKRYVNHLKKQGYQLIVLDEATRIKNSTQTTKHIKALCKTMPRNSIKLFVTGTPIENKLEDLFNVFSIIDSRLFGNSGEFKFNYTHRDMDGKILEYKNISRFKNKIRPFYIRRTSDLVWKERPALNEKYEICEMEGKQKQLYRDARKGVLENLIDLERQTQINNASLAPLMQILLSVTGTCKAIMPEYTGNDHSCKVKVLIEMINDFDKYDKMIIFSRYANKVNPHIRRDIEQQTNLLVLEASGKTKNPTEVIEEFGRSDSVLLASDSLSYGANIQTANYLVNFDLPWNPAVFSQRVGRAYRRGQKRNVNIVNLLAANTFDMEVYKKLYVKQNLFNLIFDSDLSSFKIDNKVEMLRGMLFDHAKQR